jgi:hypothetical protein
MNGVAENGAQPSKEKGAMRKHRPTSVGESRSALKEKRGGAKHRLFISPLERGFYLNSDKMVCGA